MMLESAAVSADLLREPLRDMRCRFREAVSLLSSKGYVRVEGSEDAARSRDNSARSCSIWQRHGRARCVVEKKAEAEEG